MIPVATVHRTRVDGDVDLPFRCHQCGGSALARVRATGRGESTGLPLATKPARLAEARALADLPADARDLIDLARCPACRRRSPRALRGWWVVHVVQVAFVLAIFVGVPALVFGLSVAQWAAVLGCAVAYLGVRLGLRLRQVDRRVVFAPRAP